MMIQLFKMRTPVFCAVAVAAVGLLAVPGLHAQTDVTGEPQVMDRATSDTDPMAANLRYVNRNLQAAGTMTRIQDPYSNFAQQGTVYIDPATGISGRTRPYRLEGQGFVAYLHRPLYLVKREEWEKERGDKHNARSDYAPRQDGEWTALIPPNTVYDLHPVPVMTPDQVLAQVAMQQSREGQTNEEVGNIPTNPYFIPVQPEQIETRRDTQIFPRMVNRMIQPQEMDSMFEVEGQPGSRLAHELSEQALQRQSTSERMFKARKQQWLAMKQQLAEERRHEAKQQQGETITVEVESPQRIQDRLNEIEQEMKREAADRAKMQQQHENR